MWGWKKCEKCGKHFRIDSTFDEYCPYCGQVFSDKDREKLRKQEHFWRLRFPIGVAIAWGIAILIYCLIT